MQLCCGKRAPSTSIAIKVDGKETLLPHIIDKKNGTKYLVDTGAEVSIVHPSRSDLSFRSFKHPLFIANHSPIATFGDKPITLHLGVNQKFRWIFMVADVKYNIIGADFLSYFSINVNFEKNCFELGNKSIPFVFQTVSKIEYPVLFISSNKFSDVLLKFPEVTQ